MLCFNENAALLDAGIDEEVAVGKVADFCFVLCEEFTQDWIVAVGVIFCEVIEGHSSL